MAWTYGGDPENSDRDAVRLEIGDTDTTDQQLTDAEVEYYLAQNGSVIGAAMGAVRAIIALYARLVDEGVGDLKVNYSQRLAAYKELRAELKMKLATKHGLPVAGGLSLARKQTVEEDTDRVTPAVERDQFSYPGTESSRDSDLDNDVD